MTYMIINDNDPNCWNNKPEHGDYSNCPCGNWKQHWLKFCSEITGGASPSMWPTICSVSECTEEPTLGAHVAPCLDIVLYIVPMCSACKNDIPPEKEIKLKIDVICVNADTSVTCNSY